MPQQPPAPGPEQKGEGRGQVGARPGQSRQRSRPVLALSPQPRPSRGRPGRGAGAGRPRPLATARGAGLALPGSAQRGGTGARPRRPPPARHCGGWPRPPARRRRPGRAAHVTPSERRGGACARGAACGSGARECGRGGCGACGAVPVVRCLWCCARGSASSRPGQEAMPLQPRLTVPWLHLACSRRRGWDCPVNRWSSVSAV